MDISPLSKPSSSMSRQPACEVFLSFRGADTRNNLAKFLHVMLKDACVDVFVDEEDLKEGNIINTGLIEAIDQSTISIPIISKDYASSYSCLMELDHMSKRMDEKNHIVIPIFYYINPSDVRRCEGPFAVSSLGHKDEHDHRLIDDSVIGSWESALKRIGGINGHHLDEENEVEHIQIMKRIIREVQEKLKKEDLSAGELVGVDPHVERIMGMLDVEYRNGQANTIGDAHKKVLLIHGLAGVGKTALAKHVYNQLHHLFDACSFRQNIQAEIEQQGVLSVQNKLISDLHEGNAEECDCSDKALSHIQGRFTPMKVLVLLDDVKSHKQLCELVGDLDWLGPGSRVILTSQQRDVLGNINGAESFFLEPMKLYEALKLFCRHAFGMDSPHEKFGNLPADIVAATGRLPITLKIVGSSLLHVKSKEVWKETLTILEKGCNEGVKAALERSFDNLNEDAKEIFLDIACFFFGNDKRIPFYMWSDCKHFPVTSILALHACSLIEIQDKKLCMPEILKKFGRAIVESGISQPCERSRLWKHEEALDALRSREGNKKVEALRLEFGDRYERNVSFRPRDFIGLPRLRFLKLDRADIQGDFDDCLSNLRWLDWQGAPRNFYNQLQNLKLRKLVILDLSRSEVDKDWRGWELLSEARKLKVLKLTGCVQLTATPTFPPSMELERLFLEGCSNLAVIHPSFGNLKMLVSLNMKGCSLLRELPDLRPMIGLKELLIDGTSISRINFQEGSMRKLKILSARNCIDLTDVSDSIEYLKSLKYLALDGSGIHTLPKSIGKLKRLKTVSLKNCQWLTILPYGINSETLRISSEMCSYDVFLIFGGQDMSKKYANFLCTKLIHAGISVYGDEEVLERRKKYHFKLKAVIVQSKISIPVISKGFASSKSCLTKLEQMLEYMDNNQHTIIPIFYSVDPSNYHRYNGSFERSFIEHKERGISDSVIDSWKSALHRIRKLKGYHLHENSRMDESLISEIVSNVTWQLKKTELVGTSMAVGINNQVLEMMTKLGVNCHNGHAVEIHGIEVQMVIIHGIGGIGKTTLARCVYSQLHPLFEGCSYLENIQELLKTKSLEHLQSHLVSDLLNEECIRLGSLEEGIYYIKHRFRKMRVLIVLDDVNERPHLEAFAGKLSWFGSRSRIIVTTRNLDLLNIPERVATYKVEPMEFDQSRSLFYRHAFGGSSPIEDYYVDLSRDLVYATGGIPLAIEVVGSYLYKKDKKKWHDTLQKLKGGPAPAVEQVLRTTYEALDEGSKDIFLDLACFSIGKDKRMPIYMWEECAFYPRRGIESLLQMSLVKTREDNELFVDNILRDVGRAIVYEEDLMNPGKRSRLWNHKEALDTLREKGGTESVKALCLKFADGSHNCFTSDEFQRLSNLRFLKLDNANLQGDFMNLLSNLRWLDWQGCPNPFEAVNLHLKYLLILDLSSSKVTHKWDGWHKIEMPRLKVLNLTGCNEMQITPNFSRHPHLEMLILEGCSRLVKIDPSICRLRSLVSLNLKSCSNLSVLPPEMGNMEKLEELLIDGTSIQKIPESICLMKNLKTLSASNCYSLSYLPKSICFTEALSMLLLDNVKILEIPNSIGSLVELQRLSLRDCRGIQKLPESIGKLGRSLVELDVSGTLILELPNSMKNLQLLRVLKMERCHVSAFPNAIGELMKLEEIHASHCRNLKGSIPDGIGKLQLLKILMLGYSRVSNLPESIQSLSRLQTLDLLHCDNLEILPMLPLSLTCLRISSKKMRIIPTIENLVELEELSFGDENPKELIVPPSAFDPNSTLTVRFPKLKSLELSHSQILNLGFEYSSACIPQLKKVILTGANLQGVSEFPSSLLFLSIQACSSLKSLPPIQNLINLSELELLNSAVEKIEGLGELQSLEVLAVSDCPIVLLEGLSNLTSLKRLSLKNCNSLNELNVAELTWLEVLEIHQCQRIRDVEGLEELSFLEELHVSGSEAERSSRVTDAQEGIRKSWSTSSPRAYDVFGFCLRC